MRPTKDEYYLNIAKEVAKRGTCLRRRFGAIIVKDDVIVSTGYVGAPRGAPNCIDLKTCPREAAGIPSGERYELCRSVHAEANAIINAARTGACVLGGTIYIYGEDANDGLVAVAKPCKMCKRIIINAGITNVVIKKPDGYDKYLVADWIKNDITNYNKQNITGY